MAIYGVSTYGVGFYGTPLTSQDLTLPAATFPPASGSRYTYLACDLLTGAVLAELPLSDVSFDLMLNGAGSFTGTLPLRDKRVSAVGPTAATEPSRTALYVDRDGVLVWGGIIWTRQYSNSTGMLTIGGNEFWSYFRRRFIPNYSSPNSDQLAIVQDLCLGAQSDPKGNIGVTIGHETSGVLRAYSSAAYELKPVGEAVEELSQLDRGFDFAIDVQYVAGVPTKTLTLCYPRRGRAAAANNLIFASPGNVIDFDWDEDGTAQSTYVYVQGVGEGDSMIRSIVSAPDMLDAGYPRLDGSIALKDATDQTTANDRARAESAATKVAVTVPQIVVRGNVEPVLGSYIVGDDIRIAIEPGNPRFPAGLDTVQRITQISVQPQDSNTAETVTLSLGVSNV